MWKIIYYSFYCTIEHIQYNFYRSFFRVDDSTVSRSISKLELLLLKVCHIKKCRSLSEDELETLILDATE